MFIAAGVIIVLICIYLFCIAPNAKKRSYKAPNVGYAHRGLFCSERPENSVAAFAAAVEKGVGIETDVRLTKDGIPVLFHDDTLLRMCGDKRRVIDCTLDELRALRLSGTDQTIPTLAELIETAGNKVPLLIELKGETKNTELCDAVAPALDALGENVTVESFNPILLYRMRKLRPKMARGQLVTALVSQNFPGNILLNGALSCMMLNFLSRPDFIAYDKKFPRALSVNLCIKLFRAKPVLWTAEGKEEIDECIKKGICPIFEGEF